LGHSRVEVLRRVVEVLYLDDSGSMNGANLSEARGALRKMAHLLQDSPTRVCTLLGDDLVDFEEFNYFHVSSFSQF